MRRLHIAIIAVVVVALGATSWALLRKNHDPYAGLKCPDDYANGQDRTAGFQKFVDIYDEQHASSSSADLMLARQEFFRAHGCTAALQRLADYDSGNIDPETKAMIEGIVDDYFDSPASGSQ